MSVSAAGAVYDRGYRPYDGPRGGRRAAVLALYRASIRRALGLRRPWRQKVAPFVLLAIATVPAVVNVGLAYVTRNIVVERVELFSYREYVGVSTALLVFVALTAPDIMCPDRRQRVLSVIFARPLTGPGYVLAKVGALFSIVFLFSFLPQVLLFVGQALVSDSALSYARDNLDVVWKVPVAIVVLALFHAVIGVAIASLTSRRIVAGTAFVGLFLISSVTAGILVDDSELRGDGTLAALLNLIALPLHVRDLVFLGHIEGDSALSGVEGGGLFAVLAYAAIVTVAGALALYRYRWAER